MGIARLRPRPRSRAAVLAAAAMILAAAPLDAATSDMCRPPPPASQRFQKLTETPPHPWSTPTIRSDHPRLFFDAVHLARFRAHWTDPAYASVVKEYKFDVGLDPVRQALRGLAVKDDAACRLAARTVAADGWKPKKNLSSGPPGGFDWEIFGPPDYVYGDAEALVFDWCYFALTPELKTRLVTKIEARNAMREASLDKKFQWHEAHFLGLHAYLMGVLAVAGEPGAADRLQKAQNALQNFTDIGNELHGDGGYKTYSYQDTFLIVPSILWSMATGQDVVRRNQFIMNHADFLLRRLSQDGTDFVAGPGDQASDERGMVIRLQNPSALGPLMIADYLHDGSAQWLGQFLLEKQGFGKRWDNPRWLDLIFHDDALTPVPPSRAAIPPVRYLAQEGMVDFRSAWNIGQPGVDDIDAWFYLGPMTEHAETDSGHFTLWRGNDDLITEGANYLSRPTRYHLLWSALSLARNTEVFSPVGSSSPDLEGAQLPPPTMIYDDARLFGDVGAERLVKAESDATRSHLATLSAEAYPVANRIIWYPEYAAYLGRIYDFADSAAVARAAGDASAAYDPNHVLSFRRSVIDVKPDVFIIRDRYRLRDVATARMFFHTREKPAVPGLRVIKGSETAGILEGHGNRITVTRGQSQATIQILSPPGATIRLLGGPGFENYVDGNNVDARGNTADWLTKQPDFGARIARITGTWRIEIENSHPERDGETVVAIAAGPRGAAAPTVRLLGNGGAEGVELRRGGGHPVVVSLSDTKEPDRDIAACVTN
ncbi:MAG TPA: hypothetical protein VN632_01730 [Stellaceae bacterium]|nr:hypothetical protein [Stellaceae bacterium]